MILNQSSWQNQVPGKLSYVSLIVEKDEGVEWGLSPLYERVAT